MFVGRVLEERLIYLQTIGKYQRLTPRRSNLFPQSTGAFEIAFAHVKGHDLQVAPREHQPNPRLVCFSLDKGPQFINDSFIPKASRHIGPQRRQLVYVFLSRA